MSSKTTGDRRCAEELTDTTRALPAAAGRRAAWWRARSGPRWLVANCISQPSGVRISGAAITPGVVDEDVQRAVPAGRRTPRRTPGRPGRGVDPDLLVAGGRDDVVGRALARFNVADRDRDFGARAGQCPGGLDADAGRPAGDDGPAAGQIDAVDDLGGGGLGAERRGDGGVPSCVVSRLRW